MGKSEVFNNNTNEKPGISKLRTIILTGIGIHHVVTLVMLVITTTTVDTTGYSEKIAQELNVHKELGARFLTTWNFVGQLMYIVMELALIYLPSTKLTKQIEKLSWIHFISIVWPTTIFVITVFWGLYNLDRNLILAKYCDVLLPQGLNHSLHSVIGVLLMVEALSARKEILFKNGIPFGPLRMINFVYMITYCFTLNFTFFNDGIWIYPFFYLLTWTQRCMVYIATFIACQILTQVGFVTFGLLRQSSYKTVKKFN